VAEVLRWVHRLAWGGTVAPERRSLWPVPGLCVGSALVLAGSTLADAARSAAPGPRAALAVTLVSAGVQFVLLAGLWLALSWAMPRPAVRWTALVPGALLFAGGFLAFNLAVTLYFAPRAARASALYGSLGVALVLLVSLFVVGRLAVAAAELNAALWERRHGSGAQDGRQG
jgi:uncharacterized BrkB/YihY/UPF0761 family membrane protein